MSDRKAPSPEEVLERPVLLWQHVDTQLTSLQGNAEDRDRVNDEKATEVSSEEPLLKNLLVEIVNLHPSPRKLLITLIQGAQQGESDAASLSLLRSIGSKLLRRENEKEIDISPRENENDKHSQTKTSEESPGLQKCNSWPVTNAGIFSASNGVFASAKSYLEVLIQRMKDPASESALHFVQKKYFSGAQLFQWIMDNAALSKIFNKKKKTMEDMNNGDDEEEDDEDEEVDEGSHTKENCTKLCQFFLECGAIVPFLPPLKEKIFLNSNVALYSFYEDTKPKEVKEHVMPSEDLRELLKKPSFCIIFSMFLDQLPTQLGNVLWLYLEAEYIRLLEEEERLHANDTSEGNGVHPLSKLERKKLYEKYLNSESTRKIKVEMNFMKNLQNENPTLTDSNNGPLSNENILPLIQNEVLEFLQEHYQSFVQSELFELWTGEDVMDYSPLQIYYIIQQMEDPITGLQLNDVPIAYSQVFSNLNCFSGYLAVDWLKRVLPFHQRSTALRLMQRIIEYDGGGCRKGEVYGDGLFFQVDPPSRIVFHEEYNYAFNRKPNVEDEFVPSETSSTSSSTVSSPASTASPKTSKHTTKSRRKTLKRSNAKLQVISNFEKYSDKPVEMERVVDNLTLGATIRATGKRRKGLGELGEEPDSEDSEPSSPKLKLSNGGEGRESKKELQRACAVFNEDPEKGIKYLVEKKFLNSTEPIDIAKFLHKHTKFLDKSKVGEFLGGSDELSIATMHAYIDQLDFTDLDFDIALRQLLYCFRLPGEAQKIDRILEKFAYEFYHQNPTTIFGSADAAWSLAFATIMLNTDAHNPQVKKKMTRAQFIHNCRGINDGEDIPQSYLEDIYERIILDEIRLLEDGARFPDAVKKGWVSMKVSKANKVLHKWKRWWMVLLPTQLLYFKSPGDSEPAGKLEMSEVRVIMKENPQIKKRKFCFHILRIGQGNSPTLRSVGSLDSEKTRVQSVGSAAKVQAMFGVSDLPRRERKSSMIKSASLLTQESYRHTLSLPSERELHSWVKLTRRYSMQGARRTTEPLDSSAERNGQDQRSIVEAAPSSIVS